MRFEVSYPTGVTHVVEPAGAVAVLGRDPGCDVVLNDTKCSRRHAVVEEVDGRLEVRDTGSANGIYVNGRRVDRAVLAAGDAVKLGDVQLRILAEAGATIVESDVPSFEDVMPDVPPAPPVPAGTPRAARPPLRSDPLVAPRAPEPRRPNPPRPPRPPQAPGRAAAGSATVVSGEPERPLTVTLIAGLWALFVPGSVGTILYAASRAGAGPTGWAAAATLSAALASLGVAMGLGLRSLAPWSYRMQIATAAVGLAVCPFTLASVTVLLYMSRPEVKDVFFGGRRGGPGAGASEATFAMSILGMLGLGLAVSAIALMLGVPGR